MFMLTKPHDEVKFVTAKQKSQFPAIFVDVEFFEFVSVFCDQILYQKVTVEKY